MSLVYFPLGAFRFWLDSEWGNSFSLPESSAGPWRLAACYRSRSVFMWRSWTAVAGRGGGKQKSRGKEGEAKERKESLLIGSEQVHASHEEHFWVRPIAALTQLALCWWCIYKKICGKLQGSVHLSSSLLILYLLLSHTNTSIVSFTLFSHSLFFFSSPFSSFFCLEDCSDLASCCCGVKKKCRQCILKV